MKSDVIDQLFLDVRYSLVPFLDHHRNRQFINNPYQLAVLVVNPINVNFVAFLPQKQRYMESSYQFKTAKSD